MDDLMIKQCSKCRVDKPIDEFYRNKSNASGRDHYCRVCRTSHHKEWYVSPRGREWKKEFQKTPAYLEYMKGYQKTLKRRAYMQEFRESEIGKASIARSNSLRRTSLKSHGDIVTPEQWKAVLVGYKHRCAYCGTGGPMEQDHYVPLSKGGRHIQSNLVPACHSCNSRKRHRHPSRLFLD